MQCVYCLVFMLLSALLYLCLEWYSQPTPKCQLHSRFHLFFFFFFFLLCRPCFLLWWLSHLKARPVPIFIPNDRFLSFAKHKIVSQQRIHLALSQSDLMDLVRDARAAPGSCWLAAFMAVIESECLKLWHFKSAWDKMTGWAVPHPVFVCLLLLPLLLFSAMLLYPSVCLLLHFLLIPFMSL